MNDALSDKTDSLYEFGLSGFRFQRQACPLIIQRKVRKDGAAFIQRGNIPRGQQRARGIELLKMRFVDRDCVAPQLAVETLGALARFQPFDERRSAAKRDIDRARVLIDQMKFSATVRNGSSQPLMPFSNALITPDLSSVSPLKLRSASK